MGSLGWIGESGLGKWKMLVNIKSVERCFFGGRITGYDSY